MPVIKSIAEFHDEMKAWRRELHAHPETAYEEKRTSDFIASKLESFGIKVHRGLAATGVVGTIGQGGGRAIGLRADMDALNIIETNTFAHKSICDGKMHACGHDGHVAMLLGAARYLAETRRITAGAVHFIFQPAEEMEGGGRRMVEEGLFDIFPMDAVFGMHNWPGLEAGRFAVRPGPIMAAVDTFEIEIKGKCAHAAFPDQGIDALAAASSLAEALRLITKNVEYPPASAVVGITQFHAGESWNVLPDHAVLRGTARSLTPEVQNSIESDLRRVASEIAAAAGVVIEVRYYRRYPPTVNHRKETELAATAAAGAAGRENVELDAVPSMGGEDFSFMLQAKPGSYIWIGNGVGEAGGVLHSPSYDFNDDILSIGAGYWVRLAELALSGVIFIAAGDFLAPFLDKLYLLAT